MRDEASANGKLKVISLRYFNPVGAHPSSTIGESPNDIPNNLMPVIQRVASGKMAKLQVFGNDYDTIDGSGVRDFIHIVDLARGHVKAMEYLPDCEPGSFTPFNLGTGCGTSVLQLISAFEKVSGHKIPFEITARRPGDVPELVAIPTKAETLLNWKAELGVEDMCRDSWNWVDKNPNGYDGPHL